MLCLPIHFRFVPKADIAPLSTARLSRTAAQCTEL